MIKAILITALVIIVVLALVVGLFLYSVGKMHEGHGKGWDERL